MVYDVIIVLYPHCMHTCMLWCSVLRQNISLTNY